MSLHAAYSLLRLQVLGLTTALHAQVFDKPPRSPSYLRRLNSESFGSGIISIQYAAHRKPRTPSVVESSLVPTSPAAEFHRNVTPAFCRLSDSQRRTGDPCRSALCFCSDRAGHWPREATSRRCTGVGRVQECSIRTRLSELCSEIVSRTRSSSHHSSPVSRPFFDFGPLLTSPTARPIHFKRADRILAICVGTQ
jgi:hypothetical protein